MTTRVGIIGGGQLARMMVDPAHKLGFSLIVLDPDPNSPAGQIADEQIVAELTNKKAIQELADKTDVLTIEVEVTNEKGLQNILQEIKDGGKPVHPSPKTLAIIQDKLKQNEFLQKNNLPIPDFLEVKTKSDIKMAIKKFGYPVLLKARTGAYDGRGNALIKTENQIDDALGKLHGKNLYVEKFVPFKKELAIMVARNTSGIINSYPVVETIHENNILNYLFSPASIDKKTKAKAKQIAEDAIKLLDGAGVFGVEMFLTAANEILINEIAPRVHNSGHHTIEANKTSQFEQHLRAISGMDLGETKMIVPASVMINILGERKGKAKPQGIKKAEKIPGVFVHIYGKLETRIERKMGHITVVGNSLDECKAKAEKARSLITV